MLLYYLLEYNLVGFFIAAAAAIVVVASSWSESPMTCHCCLAVIVAFIAPLSPSVALQSPVWSGSLRIVESLPLPRSRRSRGHCLVVVALWWSGRTQRALAKCPGGGGGIVVTRGRRGWDRMRDTSRRRMLRQGLSHWSRARPSLHGGRRPACGCHRRHPCSEPKCTSVVSSAEEARRERVVLENSPQDDRASTTTATTATTMKRPKKRP